MDLESLTYSWKGWNEPLYYERKKGYEPLSEAFEAYDEVLDPPR